MLLSCSIVEGRTKEGCDGESRSGQKTPVVPGAGWTAVKGWDPASGLGTPRFDKLKEIAVCQALKS